MKTTLLSTAIGSIIALSAISLPAHSAEDQTTEKCYGVAKAAKNDCAGSGHACAGQAKTDGSGKEFVKLPKGTCERLVGGSLQCAYHTVVGRRHLPHLGERFHWNTLQQVMGPE